MIDRENEEIIPNARIGKYFLNCKYDDFKKYLPNNYVYEKRVNCFIVKTASYMIWVNDETKCITQIGVYGEFKGKFLNIIGIGSTLEEVMQVAGEWGHENYVYILKNYPGICFELTDVDEWDELKAPIECIYVYKSDM